MSNYASHFWERTFGSKLEQQSVDPRMFLAVVNYFVKVDIIEHDISW